MTMRDEQEDKIVGFRMDPDEYEAFKRKCYKDGSNVSAKLKQFIGIEMNGNPGNPDGANPALTAETAEEVPSAVETGNAEEVEKWRLAEEERIAAWEDFLKRLATVERTQEAMIADMMPRLEALETAAEIPVTSEPAEEEPAEAEESTEVRVEGDALSRVASKQSTEEHPEKIEEVTPSEEQASRVDNQKKVTQWPPLSSLGLDSLLLKKEKSK